MGNIAIYRDFITAIERVDALSRSYDAEALEQTLASRAEAQTSYTEVITQAAEKEREEEAIAYYQTIAHITAGSVGILLLATGNPTAMWSGASLCGAAVASLMQFYLGETDPMIRHGGALVVAGLSLIAQRLGYFGSLAATPALIGQIALGALTCIDATAAQRRSAIQGTLETLRAEEVTHSYQKRSSDLRAKEVTDTMQDITHHHVNTVEHMQRAVRSETQTISQIMIEVRG